MQPKAIYRPLRENLRMGEGNCLLLRFSMERNDAGRSGEVVRYLISFLIGEHKERMRLKPGELVGLVTSS